MPLVVTPIGEVRSALTDRSMAPKQGDEGAPDAWLDIDTAFAAGIRDLRVGEEVILLTWLDRARRDTLLVHPRRRLHEPPIGVFSSRSPDRPNPIGLHHVTILEIDGLRIRVSNLEALDRTPLIDIKPVLGPIGSR